VGRAADDQNRRRSPRQALAPTSTTSTSNVSQTLGDRLRNLFVLPNIDSPRALVGVSWLQTEAGIQRLFAAGDIEIGQASRPRRRMPPI
jgi:hypothetical protein